MEDLKCHKNTNKQFNEFSHVSLFMEYFSKGVKIIIRLMSYVLSYKVGSK